MAKDQKPADQMNAFSKQASIIERNACAHIDNPCGGIDTDIF
jgi:hypothetical protein